jgi:anti-sigma factor RsiW
MKMRHAENCRDLLASLSDYVDGSVGDEVCLEIERHLADCQDCQIVVDTLRKTIYLYHATSGPPAMPEDVRQRLYQRLDLESFLRK